MLNKRTREVMRVRRERGVFVLDVWLAQDGDGDVTMGGTGDGPKSTRSRPRTRNGDVIMGGTEDGQKRAQSRSRTRNGDVVMGGTDDEPKNTQSGFIRQA